jgi:hypothetical protein
MLTPLLPGVLVLALMTALAQAAPGQATNPEATHNAATLALHQPLQPELRVSPQEPESENDQLFPRFQLELQGSDEGMFVLGNNIFTARQLGQFLLGFTEFLEGAHTLEDGRTLVLRQDGNQGYLALAATRSGSELNFTLTLHAEAPAGVTGDGGVHSLGLRIADQLLAPEW